MMVVALVIGFTILFLDGYRTQVKTEVNITTQPTSTTPPKQSIFMPAPSPTAKSTGNK